MTRTYSTDLVLYYLYAAEKADDIDTVLFLRDGVRELSVEEFAPHLTEADFDELDQWFAEKKAPAMVHSQYKKPRSAYAYFLKYTGELLAARKAKDDFVPKAEVEALVEAAKVTVGGREAELEAEVERLEANLTDLKLSQKDDGNYVQTIAKSKQFNSYFIGIFVVATAMFALTKLMSFIYPTDSTLIVFLTHIAFIIMAGSIAISAVWFSYNPTQSKWINGLVLTMFFMCEWVGASELFGFKTGVHLIDYTLKYAVYSLYPPTMTILLAHSSTTGGLQVRFAQVVENLSAVVAKHKLPVAVITDFKQKFL